MLDSVAGPIVSILPVWPATPNHEPAMNTKRRTAITLVCTFSSQSETMAAYRANVPTNALRLPWDSQSRSAIGIGESYSWHGMSQLRERRIEGDFVTAEMVLIVEGSRLHGRKFSRSSQGNSVTFMV